MAEQGGVNAGELFSIVDGGERGGFKIAKVLAVDEHAVHVRVYAERFDAQPQEAHSADLSLGTIHDEEFGMGHLPIDPAEFRAWQPVLLGREVVVDDELAGYRIWQEEAEGGVWGTADKTDDPGDQAEESGWRGRLRRVLGR
jgi:hypothetical protein